MFNNILVPLDGSRLSESALPPAVYLARKLDAPIMLLHVIEQDAPSEVHKERHLTNPEEAEAYLKDVVSRSFPSGMNVSTHVHIAPVSDVARSLVEHATTEFQPDLIVACTHGRGGVRDMLFGTIAQQIVAQGTTPLLLIKPGGPEFKLENILVPLDPDSIHDYGLVIAVSLAKIFDAHLNLLSVVPTFSTMSGEQAAAGSLMPGTASEMLDIKEQTTRQDLYSHLEKYRQAGVKVSAQVVRGDPVSAIVKDAGEPDVDMLVLSTHRKAGMEAFWARSVAPKIAQKVDRPLLLIPLSSEE
jgi:nucleotide-binding universal stress UspA family protein